MLETLKQKQKFSALTGLATLLCSAIFASQSFADPRFDTSYRHQVFDRNQRPDSSLVPTHMMSDEQLFLAAETLRDRDVSQLHLQANHFWLRSQQGDCYEGSAALRKFLRMSLAGMYPSLSYDGEIFSDEQEEELERESSYTFRNLENYSLRVSQRRVALKFKYAF